MVFVEIEVYYWVELEFCYEIFCFFEGFVFEVFVGLEFILFECLMLLVLDDNGVCFFELKCIVFLF